MSKNFDMIAISEAVEDALNKVFGDQTEFVSKWVMLVEAVSIEDGKRGLFLLGNKDIKIYESIGMLEYGVTLEKQRLIETDEDYDG